MPEAPVTVSDALLRQIPTRLVVVAYAIAALCVLPAARGDRRRGRANLTMGTMAVAQTGSRSTKRTMRAALGTIVANTAAPYGYTVALWSSGALLIDTHGTPSVGEVLTFVAGAAAGFAVMGMLAKGALQRNELFDHAPHRVLAGALHWLAISAAVGAVALLAQIQGPAAWPLGSLAATSIYILAASVQLAVVTSLGARWADTSPPPSPPR